MPSKGEFIYTDISNVKVVIAKKVQQLKGNIIISRLKKYFKLHLTNMKLSDNHTLPQWLDLKI